MFPNSMDRKDEKEAQPMGLKKYWTQLMTKQQHHQSNESNQHSARKSLNHGNMANSEK